MLGIIKIAVLVFAVIVHEVAHGYVAYRLGDPTARNAGRLTMNPLPHIDPFWSLLLPAVMIFSGSPFVLGGAKPVPIDPRYFRDHRRDVMIVSFAGPASNIVMAFISLAVFIAAVKFNVPFLTSPGVMRILEYSIMINTVLAVFNLIPIPPLDGSKILMGFLPGQAAFRLAALEPYGIFIVLLLLFVGALNFLLMPAFYMINAIIKFFL